MSDILLRHRGVILDSKLEESHVDLIGSAEKQICLRLSYRIYSLILPCNRGIYAVENALTDRTM